jgi:hypothetical protein
VIERMPELPCPEGSDRQIRARITEFNRLASGLDAGRLPRLLGEAQNPSPTCRELELLYGAADLLSVEAAGAYRKTMALPVDVWRAVLKIALGGLSAATLFVSSYFGSLSLPRVLADHERLARFYAQAELWLDEQGQSEELLAHIAREKLAETGNWYSYQQDNVPDINV